MLLCHHYWPLFLLHHPLLNYFRFLKKNVFLFFGLTTSYKSFLPLKFSMHFLVCNQLSSVYSPSDTLLYTSFVSYPKHNFTPPTSKKKITVFWFRFSVDLHAESTDFHWPQASDVWWLLLLGGFRLIVFTQQSETRRTDGSKLKRREKIVQIHLKTKNERGSGDGITQPHKRYK